MTNVYEKFNEDITISYTQWLQLNESKEEYIKNMPVFLAEIIEGFMEGPVALYKNNSIQAEIRTIRADDIEEFKNNMIKAGEKIIFYSATIKGGQPQFEVEYDNNNNIVNCEYKGLSEAYWVIRGAWLDKDGNVLRLNDKPKKEN